MTNLSSEELNKCFDDRQINQMQLLIDKKHPTSRWKERLDILLAAREQNNLRDHVRDFFLQNCPDHHLSHELRQETRTFPEKVLSFSDASRNKHGKKARKAAQAAKGGDQKTG